MIAEAIQRCYATSAERADENLPLEQRVSDQVRAQEELLRVLHEELCDAELRILLGVLVDEFADPLNDEPAIQFLESIEI